MKLNIISDKKAIEINGIEKISLISRNSGILVELNFHDTKFNLQSNYQTFVSCHGKFSNTFDEESLIINYSSQNIKVQCILTEEKVERANFFAKLLVYDKVYIASNLSEFFILIAKEVNS